ncbi:MAG: HD domain-containing protein [Clostridia bacterium]|nr:HD domain-containing protein [Clostridia bacterium]
MSELLTEAALDWLRERVRGEMSPYRYRHTLGVERAITALAALYCPEHELLLRAAALLHDLTKEWPHERAREAMAAANVQLRPDEQASPKIFHGVTAPLVIAADYPAFADPLLLSAVRWHTTGHADMTLTEALLYLADYIEEGRSFDDCVRLRQYFWNADPARMTGPARVCHLCDTLRLSFDMTLAALAAEGAPVCLDTLAARAAFEKKTTL